jgi:hypothetical protein
MPAASLRLAVLQRGRGLRRVLALRQPARMVGHLLIQYSSAGLGIGDEDQMAQRLHERPLLVDLLGHRCRGQPPGPLGASVQPLDGVPHHAQPHQLNAMSAAATPMRSAFGIPVPFPATHSCRPTTGAVNLVQPQPLAAALRGCGRTSSGRCEWIEFYAGCRSSRCPLESAMERSAAWR